MATLKMIAKGNTDTLTVYLRLRHGRGIDITTKINQTINVKDWSSKTNKPKTGNENGKALNGYFEKLEVYLKDQLNEAEKKGTIINKCWIDEQIDRFQNKTPESEKDKQNFLKYLDYYITDYLPYHLHRDGKKRGLAPNSYKRFTNLKHQVTEYQKHTGIELRLSDIDMNFMEKFDRYIKDQNYSDSYSGALAKGFREVIKKAIDEDLKVVIEPKKIKIPNSKAEKIILTIPELDTISNAEYKSNYLDNARDWLIIGCYTGQRVGDLLELTANNIMNKGGVLMLELIQEKTNNAVVLPILPEVQTILDKRNGQFPRKISDVKFNLYIKEVCKEAGIIEPTKGAKINPETNRKESGTYPKYELATSHVMRRSFASNFYGDIPTPLLMSATGHKKESIFLQYIGKSPIDQAQQLAEYYIKLMNERKKESNLKILRKAE